MTFNYIENIEYLIQGLVREINYFYICSPILEKDTIAIKKS